MIRRAIMLNGGKEDDNADSGAETAGSDCSKISSPSSDPGAFPLAEPLLMTVHLLANPGDSLLLQHTLDRLLQWVWPGLRLFHVSERACSLQDHSLSYPRLEVGYPSLAVTLFLHESYGKERILQVLDFLQRPPWQYHHTESWTGQGGGVHIGGGSLLRPYLLPSCNLYGLGRGMPLWGVRPVHCGGEALRVTLHSAFHNYEDAVRLYEVVLRRRAEEQKAGFCWFTLHAERGLSLQLALKQLAPGVAVLPCHSAVLQFRAGEIGQLVPLLPNPCTPISATRWQTEDLDGNKILFQVKGPAPPRIPTSAFSLNSTSLYRGTHSPGRAPLMQCGPPSRHRPQTLERDVAAVGSERCSGGLKFWGGPREESAGSDSCCSTPPSSSCYSSQRSSPTPSPFSHSLPDPAPSCAPPPPLLNHAHSSKLGEEPETNVDTGFAVESGQGRPGTVGLSPLETVAEDLSRWLPGTPKGVGTCGEGTVMFCVEAVTSSPGATHPRTGGSLCQKSGTAQQAGAEQSLSLGSHHTAALDEFFI
ncbi:hypothetical protein GJAV_G00053540 [Gymnothorax javanicus]|nr:hypothetical protein GJAV_G00053540 [Gymnothorax javanicus]